MATPTPSSLRLRPALLLAVILALAGEAGAVDFTWDGGGANNDIGTANNWNPNVAPTGVSTDNLIFTGVVRLTPNNNLSSKTFGSITFSAGGFTLGGNALTLVGGISGNAGTSTVTPGLTLGAAQAFSAAAGGTLTVNGSISTGGFTLTVAGDGSLNLNGVISGSGGLTKTGAGTCTLTDANTFTGTATINAGTLRLVNNSALANGVAVVLADAAGAVLDVNGTQESIGSLSGGGGSGGEVTLGGGRLTTGGANTSTTFAGVISGGGGLTKAGSGTFTLTGASTFTGTTVVNAGTLAVAGSLAASTITVNSGAVLAGTGSVNAVVIGAGGTLSPGGTGPASLGTGALTVAAGGSLAVQINGTVAGTDFDQVVIAGNASLTLNDATLSGSTGFSPVAGTTFTIVDLPGSGTVTGTFAGVPEGGAVVLGSAAYSVSYVGGTGNDVVLTALGTLRTWDGGSGSDSNWTTAANWVGDVAPSANDVLVFAGSTRTSTSNDFAAGTAFAAIAITATDFVLSGNAVTLGNGLRLTTGSAVVTLDLALAQPLAFAVDGGATLTISGAIDTAGSTLSCLATGTLAITGAINGTGALIAGGSGLVELSGASTYSGTTTARAGRLRASATVAASADGAFGNAASAVAIDGGAIEVNTVTFSRALAVSAAGGRLDAFGAARTVSSAISNAATGTLVSGLTGSYIATSLRAITQDDWRLTQAVSGTRVDGTLNFPGNAFGSNAERLAFGITGSAADWNDFSVQWDGFLDVVTADTTIFTRSDDGSRVWIDLDHDDVIDAGEFVSNGFGSSQGETTGVIATNLAVGTYRVRVQYEEGAVANALFLLWDDLAHSAGVVDSKAVIPAAHLSTPAAARFVVGGVSAAGAAGQALTLSGVISGAGALNKEGTSTVTLATAATYAGATAITGGTLVLGAADVLPDTAVVIATGCTLDLAGVAETVGSLNGGGAVAIGAGALTCGADGTSTTFSGVISGSGTLTKNGAGSLTLSGASTLTGAVTVSAGTLLVDGSLAAAASLTVSGTGTLGGGGTVAAVTLTAGTVAPGTAGPGRLTAAAFTGTDATGAFNVTINGTSAGVGHDQLVVPLGGSVTLNDCTLAGTLGMTLGPGEVFTIIDNRTVGAVSGTFNGLAEGATATIGGSTFTVSYVGGDGNDVTLTSQVVLGAPTTFTWDGGGANNNLSTANNWNPNVAPTGLPTDNLVFTGTTRTSPVNDLAQVGSLTFSSGGFTLSGAALTVNGGITGSTGTSTVNCALVLAASQSFTAASGATLTVGGTVNTAGHQLTAAATGTINLNGVTSGTGALVKSGNGTLVTGAAHTFSGGLTLAAGTIAISGDSTGAVTSGPLGTGTLTVNGGTVRSSSNSARTLANPVALTAPAVFGNATNQGALTFTGLLTCSGTAAITTPVSSDGLTWTAVQLDSALTISDSSPVTLSGLGFAAPRTITRSSPTSTVTLAGRFTGGGNALTLAGGGATTLGQCTGACGGVVLASGTLTAGSAATFVGGVTVQSGTLAISSSSTGAITNGPIGVGTLTVSGGTVRSSSGTNRTLANPLALNAPAVFSDATQDGDLTFSGGMTVSGTAAITSAAGAGLVTVSGTTQLAANLGLTIDSGVILSGGVSFAAARTITRSGSGTLTLSGALAGGANPLTLSGSGAATLGLCTGTCGGIVVAGPTLSANAASTFAGGVTVQSGTLVLLASTTGAVTSGPIGTGTLTVNGGTVRSDTTNRTIANPLALTAAAVFSDAAQDGDLTFSGGMTVSGTAAMTIVASAGLITVSGTTQLDADLALTMDSGVTLSGGLSFASARAITRSGAATLTLSGALAGGANTLTVSGSGAATLGLCTGTCGGIVVAGPTVTANAASTFAGGVTVQSGILALGAATTGAVTNGPVGTGTLTVSGGTLRMSDSTDRSFANALAVNGAATFGGGSDNVNDGRLTFTGTATFSGTPAITTPANFDGLTFAGGCNLDADLAVTTGAVVTWTGGLTFAAARTITTAGTAAINLAGALAGAANTLTVAGTNQAMNLNLCTGACGGLIVDGPKLSGTAASTFSGGVTVQSGILVFAASTTGAVTNGPIGTGALTMAGGSVRANDATSRTIANPLSITGTVTIGGGTATSDHGALNFTGAVTLSGAPVITLPTTFNGTTWSAATAINADVTLAADAPCTWSGGFGFAVGRTLTLTGGTAPTLSGALAGGANTLTFAGSGSVTWGLLTGTCGGLVVDGATVTSASASTFAGGVRTQSGVLRVNADTTGAVASGPLGTGTLRLAGGTIGAGSGTARTLANVLVLDGATTVGDATFTGTMSFTGAASLAQASTLTAARAFTIGGTVANGGFTLTTAGSADPTLANAISGGGGLTMNGSGTLIVSGTSTYTGATALNSGSLRLTGALSASSAVVIAAAARLTGTGSAAGSVDCAGTIAPGVGGAGTLTTGALTLQGSAVLDVEVGDPAVPAASDRLAVGGTVVLAGNLDVAAIGGFAPGTFTLITYSGATPANNLAVRTLPTGMASSYDLSVNGEVRLEIRVPVVRIEWDAAARNSDGSTPAAISATVWAAGTQPAAGAAVDTIVGDPLLRLRNTGDLAADLSIAGTGSGLTLTTGTPGLDQIRLGFSTTGAAPFTAVPAAPASAALASGLAVGGTLTIDLEITPPASVSSSSVPVSATVTVTAVAH